MVPGPPYLTMSMQKPHCLQSSLRHDSHSLPERQEHNKNILHRISRVSFEEKKSKTNHFQNVLATQQIEMENLNINLYSEM